MKITDCVYINEKGYTWPNNGKRTWDVLSTQTMYKEHLEKFVLSSNVMIQAGGNCGLIVSQFVDWFAQIYTFEPDPVNFYCLNVNLPYTNVHKIQACLGNSHGLVGMSNQFTDDVGAHHVTEGGMIPTIKIDDLKLQECNLVMLDLEGYELNALKGAENTIKKYKPVLCVESCEPWLNRYGTTSQELHKYITTNFGYQIAGQYASDYIYVPAQN